MNKSTVTLPGADGEWGSYISKYQPDSSKVLDNMFTANSKNFVTDQTGMIDKRQGGVQWNRTSFGQAAADTYEAIFESGARHFLRVGGGILSASTGTGLFDVITSGYSTLGNFEWVTYQNRTYGCNGINPPQVYDIATNYGGVSYSFTTAKTKNMGAQAPVTTPTVATPTAGGSVPVGTHRYQVTFMYYDSEESNGSPISATETTTSGFQTIPLTNIPIGGYGVTARNIYRDNNGDNNFLLVTTISDNTTTSFNDNIAQGSTPTPIPQFNNIPPTFGKCALWLDSIFIAPSGETNLVRYSNSGSPDIFDPANFITCQSDDVVSALSVYNGKLYVFGLHSVGTIEGTTPDTFYYHNLNNKIGCVDNRSIQVRSLVSVPTLWWLSDKGLYYSNGYTVEYGSDFIQDLINLQIAQVNYTTNKNTQTSFTDFAGDTYTPSIDINSQPGAVTTIDPVKTYNQTADWTGGSVVTNIKTTDSNFAEVPTLDAPAASSGTVGGSAVVSGSNITLPVGGNFTGVDNSGASASSTNITWVPYQPGYMAQPVTFPVAGTITSFNMDVGYTAYTNLYYQMSIQSSLSGGVLFTGPLYGPAYNTPGGRQTATCSIPVAAGQTVYFILGYTGSMNGFNFIGSTSYVFGNTIQAQWSHSTTGGWSGTLNILSLDMAYSFSQSGIPESGSWISPVYDCGAVDGISASVTQSGSYPGGTSSTLTVYGSPNADMSSAVTQSFSSPNGNYSLSLSGYRYWKMESDLATSDSRTVPTVGAPTLYFNTTGIWVSQPIDATTDNTGWQTLTYTGNVPSGTSVGLVIATSNDNITYSSFGPISGAATTRWAKVRLILTATSGDDTSPSVSSVTLTWAVTGTITSSIIDTGTTPAGFGVFQWSETNISVGTVTFYVRTASTSGGIPSASFVAVTNGTFPTLSALQYVQWKAVLTSTADATPVITDVTVNWYTGTGNTGIRCSSIFYNKTYYLSVATIGATTNNTIIQLDQFGKWRIQKDTSVGTFLLYFNSLYFTDGGNGNIYNGFIAATDNGTAITMDVRTKAWSSTSDMFLKVPRGIKVTGLNTGTTIHAYYSYDRGNTWIEMLNEAGATGFTTTTDMSEFVVLFVPNADTLISGRTLMYRLMSSDVFPCSIINYQPSFYTRRGRYLSNG